MLSITFPFNSPWGLWWSQMALGEWPEAIASILRWWLQSLLLSHVSSLLERSDQNSDAWYEDSGRAKAFISTPIWKEHVTSLAFTWQGNQYNFTVLHQGCQFCSKGLNFRNQGMRMALLTVMRTNPFTEFLFTSWETWSSVSLDVLALHRGMLPPKEQWCFPWNGRWDVYLTISGSLRRSNK